MAPMDQKESILVLHLGRGSLTIESKPDVCPTENCPGSDCCEEGEWCTKAAGREVSA